MVASYRRSEAVTPGTAVIAVHELPGEREGEPSENDSFIAVHEDSAFDMQADGAGEDNFFQIATPANEIFDRIAV